MPILGHNMISSSIKNAEEFLGLFYEPEIDGHELTKKTKVSLFVLRVDGSGFDYESMNTALGNASISYVFSRIKFENVEEGKIHEFVKQAQASFRDHKFNDGEGGELFLYCFLETHLKAPKILSKMELKTDANDYVKGSDGIHLLALDNNEFHLIFGESKMIGDSTERGSSLRKAVAAAFKSIKELETEGLAKEIALVDSNLMKETFSPETQEYLKKIIKPSAKDETVKKFNAFGIFVGFEIDISAWDRQAMSNEEFTTKIREEVKKSVEDRYDYIQKQIEEQNLTGYHFYVYALPFIKTADSDIDSVRKKIIEHIK